MVTNKVAIPKKSNKLTYLGEQERRGKRYYVKVKCDCGTVKFVVKYDYTAGVVVSCGCVKFGSNATHGDSTSSGKYYNLYQRYRNIKTRCYNPNAQNYGGYGKLGIKMCDEWYYSFENFKDWSLKNGYKEELSIDRIDSTGNYEPDNCRWVDYKVQGNNKKNNVIVEIDGVKKTIAEWLEVYDIAYYLAYQRYSRGIRGKDVFKPSTLIFWSEEDKQYLKDNYRTLPTSVLAEKLNRTEGSVRTMYKSFKLK